MKNSKYRSKLADIPEKELEQFIVDHILVDEKTTIQLIKLILLGPS